MEVVRTYEASHLGRVRPEALYFVGSGGPGPGGRGALARGYNELS